ncbi:MAG TPA: hypothetical protein VHF47_04655 [Acidimicrobiales bacterium]|nr:hypothetical protein [Acidimicrobiales bacterium]
MDQTNEQGDTGAEPVAEGSRPRARGSRRAPDPLVEGAPVASEGAVDEAADEADAGIPTGAGTRPFTWVGVVTTAAVALVAVQVLVFLGAITQGLSVDRLDGDIFHKLGVAFLSNLGAVNGLSIVLASLLAGLPALLRAEVPDIHDRRRSLALSAGSLLALALILATPIAVRARLRVLDIGNQEVDALARWVLVTYTVSTLGTAAVALASCLGFARINRTVTPPS